MTAWHALLFFASGLLLHSAVSVSSLAREANVDESIVALRPDAGSPPAPGAAAKTSEPTTSEPTTSEPTTAAAGPEQDSQAPVEESAGQASSSDESLPSGFTRGDAQAPRRVRELSVPPETKPLLPVNRPAWVGAAPELTGNNHRLFVGSYPTATPEEAEAALDVPLVAAVNGYIDETILRGSGAQHLHLSPEFVRKNLVDPATEYMAELSTSQGPLYQKWVVLKITPEHRKHFFEMHRQLQQQKRLVALGIGVLSLIGATGAANVMFNRRRRRYVDAPPPGTFVFAHEDTSPVIAGSKPRRRGRAWLLALGGVGLLCLMGSWTTTRVERRSVRHASEIVEHINSIPANPPVEIHLPEMPEMPQGPMRHPRKARVWVAPHESTIEARSYSID